MSPDLVERVRALLNDVAAHGWNTGEGYKLHDRAEELLAALPPDPGGAMPPPWPLWTFAERQGFRRVVESAGRLLDGTWAVFVAGCEKPIRWTPENVTEIRDATGRVVWRGA